MIIRLANKTDILKISRLWLQMVGELAPELTPNANWWREIAANQMEVNNYKAVVAEVGGKLLGFVDYFIFPEPATGKIHCVGQHLFILPEHRGSDIAGKLWRCVLKQSRKDGAKTHELFCFVNQEGFWNHHGFKKTRILMRKGG